jgi:hypothetical protein
MALTACQSLEVESQPLSRPSLAERSRVRKAPQAVVSTLPEPYDVIKAHDPFGILLSRPRDTWSPLARREATGAPNHGTRSH